MRSKKRSNPKRRVCTPESLPGDPEALAADVGYGGNPEHKRKPGHFGPVPPSHPRSDESLCDAVDIFRRDEALALLRKGIRRGCVSRPDAGRCPQDVWAVTWDGHALEAQLENAEQGTYHGYPMSDDDPLRPVVLARWRRAKPRSEG